MKNIVIESLVNSQKVAVLEDGKLSELFIESNSSKSVSNIYRGVVKKALKGIEAYFVDIGSDKLAYLSMKKNEEVKCGQDILVQVNKEAIGTKGAKLNTEISFAGRYLVYIPSNDRLTISNKIKLEKERFRLKKIVQGVDEEFTGIIRTEAVGCSKEEIEQDIFDLKEKYNTVLKEYKLGIGPKLLYKDLDFASKYVKDNVNDSVLKIIVNNNDKYEELKNILGHIDKNYKDKLLLENNKDVFDLYSVQSQIDKCLNRKVWLKSGGYLIIDKTEALTVIDVNTGKFTGNSNLEETIYQTNLEAAIEISKLLRIRDIAGIIIVDFIDMQKNEYKKNLLEVLSKETDKDRRKTNVMGMTKLGLVEIARRREKDSIDNYYLSQCFVCKTGESIKSINRILDEIEKEVMRIKEHTSYRQVKIELNPYVSDEIDKNYKDKIDNISKKYNVKINIDKKAEIQHENMNIIFNS
ncbi:MULTISPECIES: Rne/Rng family ribonuclease [Paraclostridium]|uniref:Rne/Rng family ribonuclease n=2 Tax=Paraclostridium TaxID=1849822 RepID=A0AA44DL13_PARBF|nr:MULTISPECIES: Rne/Rng family ribonuclease [Paraclostridium]MBN8046259.1 Rne/Rng family ribonuclease [Paraclostridium bifermentans]MBZ6005237.1 Rne/Rng family ribonuclease [Paraclostridium bifermentans]MDU0296828.1 Rne/Rng family ribonuclease [Paraclostridium sp. MRS3W1]NME09693.1 Rne/Rng family ribonuclease [Paraclostridium bifermentans]TQO58309.1 Rne/Rng family ribonuclease [Paraclostridium bifermentans]